MLRRIFVAGLVLLAQPALAAEPFVTGVYLQNEDLCARAKAEGLQTLIDESNLLLTDRGIESVEYNCEFTAVTRAERSPTWIVTAVCQQPGYVFPDLLTVTQMNDKQIDIASVRPDDPESGTGGNAGSWFLCDGVDTP